MHGRTPARRARSSGTAEPPRTSEGARACGPFGPLAPALRHGLESPAGLHGRSAAGPHPVTEDVMTEIRPNVSEHEARAVAEGARETTWEAPSFVRELFLGHLDLSLIHPWPEPDAEEQQRAEAFLEKLERFLREQV